jgi:hypothetical protein
MESDNVFNEVIRALGLDMESSAPPNTRSFDWPGLNRLAAWGVTAATALVIAVLSARTDTGAGRLASALSTSEDGGDSAIAVPVVAEAPARPAFDAEAELKQVSEQIRGLAADRERLLGRLTSLERNIEDVTGSISRQISDVREATMSLSSAVKSPQQSSRSTPPPAEPPAVSAPATQPAATPYVFQRPPAPPPYLAQSIRTAMLPVPGHSSAAPATDPAASPLRARYGVDLGGATSLAALRALWSSLSGSLGPLMANLHPIVAVRDGSRPDAAEVRLVAGPLPDERAAANLCAILASGGRPCRTALYEGQPLAAGQIDDEPPPVRQKPARERKPRARTTPSQGWSWMPGTPADRDSEAR